MPILVANLFHVFPWVQFSPFLGRVGNLDILPESQEEAMLRVLVMMWNVFTQSLPFYFMSKDYNYVAIEG